MAFNFTFNPNEYEAKSFEVLPEGDYRVRISDVIARNGDNKFNSGNEGFEVVLEVSGSNTHLWFYLVINTADTKKTNQKFGTFFDSFGITNYDINAYKSWVGKVGACRVFHEDYEGNKSAKVKYLIARNKQDKLPAWVNPTGSAAPTTTPSTSSQFVEIPNDDSLPF